jgi:hypothetical protein
MMTQSDWDAAIGHDLRVHGIERARRTMEDYAQWRDARPTVTESLAAAWAAAQGDRLDMSHGE